MVVSSAITHGSFPCDILGRTNLNLKKIYKFYIFLYIILLINTPRFLHTMYLWKSAWKVYFFFIHFLVVKQGSHKFWTLMHLVWMYTTKNKIIKKIKNLIKDLSKKIIANLSKIINPASSAEGVAEGSFFPFFNYSKTFGPFPLKFHVILNESL